FIPDEGGYWPARVGQPSVRSRLGSVAKPYVVEHMELFVHPTLSLPIPPRLVVVERHAGPPVQRGFQTVVALAIVPPAKQSNQFMPSERNFAVRKSPLSAQLNQPKQYLVVECGRQAKGVRARNGQLPGDIFFPAFVPKLAVLKLQRLHPRSQPVRQRAERKFCQVHLILRVGTWLQHQRLFDALSGLHDSSCKRNNNRLYPCCCFLELVNRVGSWFRETRSVSPSCLEITVSNPGKICLASR